MNSNCYWQEALPGTHVLRAKTGTKIAIIMECADKYYASTSIDIFAQAIGDIAPEQNLDLMKKLVVEKIRMWLVTNIM